AALTTTATALATAALTTAALAATTLTAATLAVTAAAASAAAIAAALRPFGRDRVHQARERRAERLAAAEFFTDSDGVGRQQAGERHPARHVARQRFVDRLALVAFAVEQTHLAAIARLQEHLLALQAAFDLVLHRLAVAPGPRLGGDELLVVAPVGARRTLIE